MIKIFDLGSYKTDFVRNFLWRTSQIIVKQGISFLIFLLCAQFLSKENFGLYNYLMAAVFFVVMLGDFGISTAATKYTAEYNALKSEKLNYIFFNSLVVVLSLTLLLLAVIAVLGRSFFGDSLHLIFLLFPVILFGPLTSLLDGIYRGLRLFKKLAVLTFFAGIISVPVIYFLIRARGLEGILLGQGFFYVTLFAILIFSYRKFIVKLNMGVMKEVSKYSLVFGLAVLGYYLFSRIDILILGKYGFLQEIAVYELFNKFLGIPLLLFGILGQVIAPDFTELYAKKEYNSVKKRYVIYMAYSVAISILVSCALYFLAPSLVKTFFITYYDENFLLLLFPCVAIYAVQFVSAPLNSGIVVSTGHAGLMTYMNLVMGVVNVILAFFLLHVIGFIGVIYATLISNLLGTVVLQYRFYSKIHKLCLS